MNSVKTIKKVAKVFGIGFVGLVFLGCIISDSENSALVEQLQQENQELKLENERLEVDIDVLEDELDMYKDMVLAEPVEPEPIVEEPVVEEPKEVVEEPVPVEEVEEPVVANKDIERLQIQEVSSENTYGILTITVSLVADKDYTYLDIEIPVYDSEGYLIGSAIGIASDIKAGQKAKVECTSFDEGTYKLEELTVDSY